MLFVFAVTICLAVLLDTMIFLLGFRVIFLLAIGLALLRGKWFKGDGEVPITEKSAIIGMSLYGVIGIVCVVAFLKYLIWD